MSFVQIAKNSIKIIIGVSSFLLTFYTMINLMYFLSSSTNNITRTDYGLSISKGLLVDMCLLTLFIFQHSFLNEETINYVTKKFDLKYFSRTVYVICTSIVLEVLVRYWHDISEVKLWEWNMNFSPIWWLYVFLHVSAWIIIYVGNICMDVNELLGIKQIYYNIARLPEPNVRKSAQLKRLNSHMRHPSVLAFFILFWSVPIMSLDRLLLALVCTFYMFISWRTDDIDYAYQEAQYVRKFHELERLDH